MTPREPGRATGEVSAALHGPAMTPVIETHQISRRIGRTWALARVDLTVQEGERLLVLGSNGSGKTTLLRVLATLLTPTRGGLRLFGQDVAADPLAARRRIGLVTHSPGVYEDLSGLDNLAVQASLLGLPVPADLLARVGLDQRPDPVRNYSAGMRKRLSFALMLHKQADLVLLDEPFAMLDPAGMDQAAALIRDLPGTVVVASHQVRRASALCDRALLLEEGLPRWLGPASEAWEAWGALHGGSTEDALAEGPVGASDASSAAPG